MQRPERPFFFAAAGVLTVNIVLFFVGVPAALRLTMLICALVLVVIGTRRRNGQFR